MAGHFSNKRHKAGDLICRCRGIFKTKVADSPRLGTHFCIQLKTWRHYVTDCSVLVQTV